MEREFCLDCLKIWKFISIHNINKQNKPQKLAQYSLKHMAKTMHLKLFLPLYSILTITLLCLMPSQINSSTLEADTLALQEIKRAIDPNSVSPSSYLSSWDFSVDPCESTGSQFLGILCNLPLDNSSSRVTAIDLDTIGYDGFLTPAIGNLTELTLLNLDKNKFRGPIPQTISNLRKLTRLTLSDNFFTGPIPSGISALKNLQYLDVSFNRLSGALPSNFSGLRSLTYMSLSNNAFAGRLPDLTGLWQLQTLDLSTNQFYGDIPNLPISLRKIYINHNIFSGHMTPLKGLKRLKWVDVSDNRLSGPISKDIMSLKQLVHLNVSYNRFITLEVINYSLEGPQLQVLEAQGNHLRGHLPVNLVTLRNLTNVNLANNEFSGTIPNEYGAKVATTWRRLYLDHNFLTGNLPPEFALKSNVRGSLANNCLKCPPNIVLCHGAQRPATELSELEEGLKVLDSSLALIKWHLKPSSKRRLQLDIMALCTRLRPVVMLDYGGKMPELQHCLSALVQLIHKESPIFEHLRVMVIQDMIYLIHLTELAHHVRSTINSELQLLFVDLEHEPPKMITEIEKSQLAMQLLSIQKFFSTVFTPEGMSNPSPSLKAKCSDNNNAESTSQCFHSHSIECIDLSSCLDDAEVTLPTLNGWLLGYPVVYLFGKEHIADSIYNLSTKYLHIFQVFVSRNSTLKKGIQPEELLSFSVPYNLSMRGSNEQWAQAFLAHMRMKWERCANAWKSLNMEVSECHPQAIVL
ncbi:hypothetical protein RIF29_27933 [Crotalaria pallida]|uniref:Leucine-rich repeat-containing N-terminal plant-type domain-containing protein n=1 Tax=Crotalaria pallida TaxID=3830 RepID=A0AAN9EXE8_CROPI